jgi:hypothetical protein
MLMMRVGVACHGEHDQSLSQIRRHTAACPERRRKNREQIERYLELNKLPYQLAGSPELRREESSADVQRETHTVNV